MARVKPPEIGPFREQTPRRTLPIHQGRLRGPERFPTTEREPLYPGQLNTVTIPDWTALSGHRHYRHRASRIGFAKRRERYY